ncbi:hypothetical protein M0813_05552 [Anaeramoeba flamelloides]|uniref:HSF-type DNA-binding domain-containing protein n=1 Tax=Anaeramoeba flamelloides TaxID=1746091 RepID=A0ABQ8XGQ1_9EUKA|nr:hypothetical protein M0813_05552 [Anaeramoeba flamelloides]
MTQQTEKRINKLSNETGLDREESKFFLSIAKGDYMTALGLHVLCHLQNIKNFTGTNTNSDDLQFNSSNLKIAGYGKNQQESCNQSSIMFSTRNSNILIKDSFLKNLKLENNTIGIHDFETEELAQNRKRKPLGQLKKQIKKQKTIQPKLKTKQNSISKPKSNQIDLSDIKKRNNKKRRKRSTSESKKVKKQLKKILKSKKITFKQLRLIMTTDPMPGWKDRFSIFKYYDSSLITNWPGALESEDLPIIIDKRFFKIYHSFRPNILAKNLQRGMTYFFESHGFRNCSKFHRKKMIFERIKTIKKEN